MTKHEVVVASSLTIVIIIVVAFLYTLVMLSRYLKTAAVSSPNVACDAIVAHVHLLYPASMPCSRSSAPLTTSSARPLSSTP